MRKLYIEVEVAGTGLALRLQKMELGLIIEEVLFRSKMLQTNQPQVINGREVDETFVYRHTSPDWMYTDRLEC